MDRSPRFGSISSDNCPMKTRFRYGSGGSLNQATAYESPAHSSTGTRSEPRAPPTAWELTVSCSISLPDGVLFTLPSRYYFAIGHPGVFSLARWSLLIHTGFHVPHATRVRA
uniref:ORF44l n=1 Tax=Populus alba TaxID=43335 RepID=A0A4U5PRX0_POPAL|nr:ORF44l [Populus alba]